MTVWQKTNWQVPCFFGSILLFYPLVWVRLFTGHLPFWSELSFFTPGMIALLGCFLLLFNPKILFSFFSRRDAQVTGTAFAFMLLVALIQLKVCCHGRTDYLWSSVYWVAVPLFCAVNRREVEKYLPFFMTLAGTATIIQSFQDLHYFNYYYGLPGNWNWNASLLAVTLPFIALTVYRCLRKYRKTALALIIFLAAGGVFLILGCRSKAALLALITAAGLIAVLRYWREFPLICRLGVGIFAAAGLILLWLFRAKLIAVLGNDQRFFLWSGALGLIRQHFWLGCGPELFESAYAPHIPTAYYSQLFVVVRHTHAHNHLLHFAATMGIPALLAWSMVIAYIVIKNLRRAIGKGDWQLKLYLFCSTLLAVHSMFDIIVLSWPLGCIFLTFFGILLGRAVETSPYREFKAHDFLPVLSSLAALCCLVALGNSLTLNFLGSLHYYQARVKLDKKDLKSAFSEIEESIVYKPTAQNTYLAAKLALYDFKNPARCLKFLDQLAALGFENYEHNNQLRAKALAAGGKLSESLIYFAREQDNFPLSCVNLYYYRLILNRLGRKAAAAAVDRDLQKLLKLKGFTEAMLPALIADPGRDLRYVRFNAGRK
ncbi:MAG: O-antigen ligase family protein [Victivallaceae bacterium]|nr:O-antigen ligase family protein [Victivallaceae bacterium]